MATIAVTGRTLGAVAAAARLAKLGHRVTYVGAPDTVGGHWRVDLPPVISLPATWRDLFRKSGRALDAELERAGLALVEAPAAIHRFSDGVEFALPAERGAQFGAISSVFGVGAAERWRDLLDEVDGVWAALRSSGIEEPRTRQPDRRLLLGGLTLTDLARRVAEPHLGAIIESLGVRCGTDSGRAPALLATRLVVERTFGRWQLADEKGPLPAERLLGLLTDRLRTRRVEFADGPGEAEMVLDFSPAEPAKRWLRTPVRPALAPTVTVTDSASNAEIVTHTPAGIIVDWPGLRYDYTTTASRLAWGYAPDDWASWWARPEAASAGNEPWAELANAALRVYESHATLTGDDVRPSNRSYRP